jgi:hypothetical protein
MAIIGHYSNAIFNLIKPLEKKFNHKLLLGKPIIILDVPDTIKTKGKIKSNSLIETYLNFKNPFDFKEEQTNTPEFELMNDIVLEIISLLDEYFPQIEEDFQRKCLLPLKK